MSIVVTEDRGPVRHIVMNRPEKRNAMNDELIAGIGGAVHAATRSLGPVRDRARRGPDVLSGMDFSSLGALAGEPAAAARVPHGPMLARGTCARR